MLALLIETVQQRAAQIPPEIHVTVQQPSGGMPEWVKILISALVGASFGILNSISMEYVKPWISRRLLKRTIKKHLNDEFLGNLTAIDAAQAVGWFEFVLQWEEW
jgi:hypothetical protein